jgi:hypothetical protein
VTPTARTPSIGRLLLLAATAVALVAAPVSPARGDTAPVPPEPTPTVAADALPTVQINGVVWAQVVAGNRVYATGSFTRARPAGAAAGTSETARSNILAYDLTTGALVTSWAPSLNATGRALAASPDGTRIYVGGEFTSVSGVARQRIAALDATSGAVVTSFNAGTNSRVNAVAVSGSTVYAGGAFSTANGASRARLAAFSAANGAVIGWNPGADSRVLTLAAPAASGKVVAGGAFTTLGGVANYGMGAVDATTGTALAWPINQVVRNAGDNAAIYSLSTNGSSVFGTGYTFGGGGNFEGTFAADTAGGNLTWVTGCRGDTYSAIPLGGVLYSVGHAHDCSSIGGNPQTDPWSYQYAIAQTVGRGPNSAVNVGGTFQGRPAPMYLHWLPTLTGGSFTGQSQAAWSVAGNANYVVLGGEFPRVNGIAQQGLTRFALRALAPNRQGPQGVDQLKPTLAGVSAGSVRVSWQAAWDRDNKRLTYQVLRGPTASTATVVTTRTADTTWWNRPSMSVTDATAPPGSSQTYRVRATDPLGNVVTSAATVITVPAAAAATTGSTATGDTVDGTTTSGSG